MIVTTKIGNTLIYDRLTGNSFHDIFYDNVPLSDFSQEEISPKQINLKIPDPLIKFETSKYDLDDRIIAEPIHDQRNQFRSVKNLNIVYFKKLSA